LVEHGLFAREMNAGWEEWVAAKMPTHSTATVTDYRCSCSDQVEPVGAGA